MFHQGRDRTSWLVKTRFFWIGMDSDIENKVRQTERYKSYYDQRVRESKLEVGDRVLIRALGLKGTYTFQSDVLLLQTLSDKQSYQGHHTPKPS